MSQAVLGQGKAARTGTQAFPSLSSLLSLRKRTIMFHKKLSVNGPGAGSAQHGTLEQAGRRGWGVGGLTGRLPGPAGGATTESRGPRPRTLTSPHSRGGSSCRPAAAAAVTGEPGG